MNHPRNADDGVMVRFTNGVTCPICGGCEHDPRGNGTRCWGFKTDDWAHCTRVEFANGCDYNDKSEAFVHKLKGKCKCGVNHGPDQLILPLNGKGHGEIECVYPYRDASGKVIYEVVRFRNPKDFRQRRPGQTTGWSIKGIEPVLYRLPEILAAAPDRIIWICEGEKDVDNLVARGRIATCNSGGAGKWRDSYSEVLRGRHCRISPHNDEKGRQHAQQVAQSLAGKASTVKIVELPGLAPKGDISDWFASGGTIADLDHLADAKAFEDVNNDPLINKDGRWISCLKNSEIWLLKQPEGSTIRYDTFQQCVLIGESKVRDEMVIDLTARIETQSRSAWADKHIRNAIDLIGVRNQFSSLTSWLDSLKWDGEYRVNTFFNEAYDIPHSRYAGECSRVLFLSAIARAYQPGCQADVMVVLIGRQGSGKSTGIASLCPREEWFAEDLGSDLSDPKTLNSLQGKWLIEFSEFSRINRSTLDMVKSFLTRRVDTFIRPYGHFSVSLPRSCVFVGTTNDAHPLRDSENRRFMPITCNRAQVKWIESNRDQLWAEAVVRFQDGEKWWVDDDELVRECEKEQEHARMEDAWEAILGDRLENRATTDMAECASLLGVKTDRLDRSTQVRIGFVLNAIGFKRKRVRDDGKRVYLYERSVDPSGPIF